MLTFRPAALACACALCFPAHAEDTPLPPLPPSHGVHSFASVGSNRAFFPQAVDNTRVVGATATLVDPDFRLEARTESASQHVFAEVLTAPAGGLMAHSSLLDTVTITGGTGVGTVEFQVRVTGTVDVGAAGGLLSYNFTAGPDFPAPFLAQAFDPQAPFEALGFPPDYSVFASPYANPATLTALGIVEGVSFDRVLAPGAGQSIDALVTTSHSFTYDQPFFIASSLFALFGGSILPGDGLPPPDGVGSSRFDFADSAQIVSILLPAGASASFASGTAYPLAAVPEPGVWGMLVAGLAVVGLAVRRRRCA